MIGQIVCQSNSLWRVNQVATKFSIMLLQLILIHSTEQEAKNLFFQCRLKWSCVTPHSHGVSASTPLVYFEWSDIKRLFFLLKEKKFSCRTELWVRSISSLALLAAVENISTFQAPTQASANQIPLCKYSSADASQSRSCNTRKVIWLAVVTVTVASAPSFRHALRQALTPMPRVNGA